MIKKIIALTLSTIPLLTFADEAQQVIAQGEYLSRASDCMACHTSDTSKPYAGGVRFVLPIGTLYSTNITPDPLQGIGSYTEKEFSRALREGIAKDGSHLYPAMPYTSYAHLSDQDIHALYLYFMHGVTANRQPNKANEIPWYLSARWPLRFWNALHAPKVQNWQPHSNKDQQWNRGAWLVAGPGHCGACHTPRGWMMQEKATSEQSMTYLSGAEVEGWYAPSLRMLPYDAAETALLLKQGHNRTSAVTGPMSSVITDSTQYLSDDDRQAIGIYLQSIATSKPVINTASNAQWYDPEKNYQRYCSTCHGTEGEGVPNVVPALQRNLLATAPNPVSLIRVIAMGAETPLTQGKLSWPMPGYRETLSNQQLADLTNYIRGRFAGIDQEVTASQIKSILTDQ